MSGNELQLYSLGGGDLATISSGFLPWISCVCPELFSHCETTIPFLYLGPFSNISSKRCSHPFSYFIITNYLAIWFTCSAPISPLRFPESRPCLAHSLLFPAHPSNPLSHTWHSVEPPFWRLSEEGVSRTAFPLAASQAGCITMHTYTVFALLLAPPVPWGGKHICYNDRPSSDSHNGFLQPRLSSSLLESRLGTAPARVRMIGSCGFPNPTLRTLKGSSLCGQRCYLKGLLMTPPPLLNDCDFPCVYDVFMLWCKCQERITFKRYG